MINNGARVQAVIPGVYEGHVGMQGDRIAFFNPNGRPPRAGMLITVDGEGATIREAGRLPEMPTGWWQVRFA